MRASSSTRSDRPRLPRLPAVHRVVARPRAPARAAARRASTSSGQHDDRDHGREREPQQRRAPRHPGCRRARLSAGAATARPGEHGEDREQRQRRRPRRRRRPARPDGSWGRSSPQGPRAAPEKGAGAPDHASPVGDVTEHRGAGGDLGARRRRRPGQQGAAGADPGVGADPHRADVQVAAVEPVPGEVDLGLDRAAAAQGEQAGDRGDAVQVDVLADPAAEQPGVDLDQRRRRQAGGAELVDEPLGEPEPQVHACRRAGGRRGARRRARPGRRRRPAAIRPSGLTSSSQPSSTQPQPTSGSQSRPKTARPTRAPTPTQVSQRSGADRSGSRGRRAPGRPGSSTGTGRTAAFCRPVGVAMSSSAAASSARPGWS